MKSKFTVGFVVAVGVVSAGLIYLRLTGSGVNPIAPASLPGRPETAPIQQSGQNSLPSTNSAAEPAVQNPTPSNVVAASTAVVNTSGEDYVNNRIELLDTLSRNDDAASLGIILSELTNSDARIRKAALEASIQFDSADAIPTLKQDAAIAKDPVEKQGLLDAAKFLALPSIAESGIRIVPIKKTPAQIPAPSANQTAN